MWFAEEYNNNYLLFQDSQIIKKGPQNIYGARLLNLTYANFLKYARDYFNAEIYGKEGYPYLIFKEKKDVNKFIKLLNEKEAIKNE